MEKFMLIFQGSNNQKLSAESRQSHMGKWMNWVDQLRKSEIYLSGEPLLPGGKLVSGKNKAVTEAAIKQEKEMVGGYFIINANDIDEAVDISKDCPDYELGGSVEVRQVMKM